MMNTLLRGKQSAASLRIILETEYYTKENPTFEEIEQAIGEMLEDPDDFIVLERYPLLKGCVYLQAAPVLDTQKELGYVAEIRLQRGEAFQHYRFHTVSVQDIINIFADFYIAQQLPPVEEWEDVTAEFEGQADRNAF